MSTSPDALVTTLSRWLARHVDDVQLRDELEGADTSSFSPEQAEAVDELREELARGNGRGELEMVVRETLEALALG
jgi:hypothetical protein